MKEQRNATRAVKVKYPCECKGEYKYLENSPAYLSHPPKYLHKCTKCGKLMLFTKKYPCIEYV